MTTTAVAAAGSRTRLGPRHRKLWLVLHLVALAFPPIVSLTALSLATVLAVYKPWGRVRSTAGGARR